MCAATYREATHNDRDQEVGEDEEHTSDICKVCDKQHPMSQHLDTRHCREGGSVQERKYDRVIIVCVALIAAYSTSCQFSPVISWNSKAATITHTHVVVMHSELATEVVARTNRVEEVVKVGCCRAVVLHLLRPSLSASHKGSNVTTAPAYTHTCPSMPPKAHTPTTAYM